MTVETSRQLSRRTVCRYIALIRNTIDIEQATDLDTLRIHLIILLWIGPVKAGVSLLADKQIREIHLFKFQFYRLDELRRHEVSGFASCIEKGNEIRLD